MGIVNADVDEIEIIPVAKGILARWWMVVIAALLGIVVMWSQESELSITPASTKVVRIYESRDETALLSLVDIDPATVSPFPSFDSQIVEINGPKIREQISESTGLELEVSIGRSEQRFSLLNTVEGDGKTKFTFLSVGTPTYTFSCTDASPDNCNTVIDEYVIRLSQMRKESIVSGLDRLQLMLESLQLNTTANLDRIAAISSAKTLINGELALLSTTNMPIGGTVSTVKSSTYAFGFVGGAFVGLLLALQLTLIDKRVRTRHQLSKKFGPESVLGEIRDGKHSVEHVAAAIVAKAAHQSISAVSVLPANEKFSVEVLGNNLSAITHQLGLTVEALPEINLVNASQLLSSPRAAVVVAESGKTRFEEIERTCAILRATNTLVLGILLVWPTE
jgi:capsular polysaccharide biosynthesis protein